MIRHCLDCGRLIHNATRCPAHERLHAQHRRGTRQEQGYGAEWQRVRLEVLERDGYECQLRLSPRCRGIAETVDHLLPKKLGGSDDIENLVAACIVCNSAKRDRVSDPRRAHSRTNAS